VVPGTGFEKFFWNETITVSEVQRMSETSRTYRGRGAGYNPSNPYTNREAERLPESLQDDEVETEYYEDRGETILTENQSPDVPFTYSINPYRGCEHGCIYCYARPTHEYLDLSAGTDFESKIFVKRDAPERLSEEFQSENWTPQVVALSGNTDPYQPAEEQFEITRECLKIFLRHRNPVSIITKNYRITRDLDLLEQLAEKDLVKVHVSVTSLDRELIDVMEPRTTRPERRLRAIEELSDAGVPVGVNAAPMIPGLTDHELPSILEAADERGAESAAYIMVRLPGSVKELFEDWLERNFPDRKDKVLNQIRNTREGDLNDSNFGQRMKGSGEHAEFQNQLFETLCKKHELNNSSTELTTERYRERPDQINLFPDR
jgi:DNA repair photolyase